MRPSRHPHRVPCRRRRGGARRRLTGWPAWCAPWTTSIEHNTPRRPLGRSQTRRGRPPVARSTSTGAPTGRQRAGCLVGGGRAREQSREHPAPLLTSKGAREQGEQAGTTGCSLPLLWVLGLAARCPHLGSEASRDSPREGSAGCHPVTEGPGEPRRSGTVVTCNPARSTCLPACRTPCFSRRSRRVFSSSESTWLSSMQE